MNLFFIFLCLFCLFISSFCGKPIIFYHGFGGSHNDFNSLIQWINATHPGTQLFSLAIFEHEESYLPLLNQVEGVISQIDALKQQHNFSSFHLMCHSQGGLVCRVALEMMEGHGVDKFISLSGVQMGQYGVIGWMKEIFPQLVTEEAYLFFYTEIVQYMFSAANYWKDPYHLSEYLTDVIFLPVMNNETYNPQSDFFRKNFLETNEMHFLGGPDDGIITPWQSALWGFYAENDDQTVVPMKQQPVFLQDWFGLQTLYKQNRLFLYEVPNAYHTDWLFNRTLFDTYLEPLLN
jgi:palmitoyl-protein thioesterase